MLSSSLVNLFKLSSYNYGQILSSLPDNVFSIIKPSDVVILKPNWIRESHQYKEDEWDYVITHPTVVTAVLEKVVDRLDENGRVVIIDGPETPSSFEKIIARYPVDKWKEIVARKKVTLEIIDLRDKEWKVKDGVVLERRDLPGDPRGSTEVNLLDDNSEFYGKNNPRLGYYGADFDIKETNEAHDGHNNRYRVSRTVIEGDVFINLPKLKTHKKSGITCCLKNLVGINTYRNFLPHHAMGSHSDGGDAFKEDSVKTKVESSSLAVLKQYVIRHSVLARILRPFKTLAKKVFGDTNEVIRSGNWYGNDTIWRMIIDLNKVLMYANPDGSFRESSFINAKSYIGIVDGILAGDGNGPKAPDPVELGYLYVGTNPVAIDAVCAKTMGFDPLKITSISHSFNVKNFPIADFSYDEIEVNYQDKTYRLSEMPQSLIVKCNPHFGWKNYLEV